LPGIENANGAKNDKENDLVKRTFIGSCRYNLSAPLSNSSHELRYVIVITDKTMIYFREKVYAK